MDKFSLLYKATPTQKEKINLQKRFEEVQYAYQQLPEPTNTSTATKEIREKVNKFSKILDIDIRLRDDTFTPGNGAHDSVIPFVGRDIPGEEIDINTLNSIDLRQATL